MSCENIVANLRKMRKETKLFANQALKKCETKCEKNRVSFEINDLGNAKSSPYYVGERVLLTLPPLAGVFLTLLLGGCASWNDCAGDNSSLTCIKADTRQECAFEKTKQCEAYWRAYEFENRKKVLYPNWRQACMNNATQYCREVFR